MEINSMKEQSALPDMLDNQFTKYANGLYRQVDAQELKQDDILSLGDSKFTIKYSGSGTNEEGTTHVFEIFSSESQIGGLSIDDKAMKLADESPIKNIALYGEEGVEVWQSSKPLIERRSAYLSSEMKAFIKQTSKEVDKLSQERDKSHSQTDS